ncbi:MAG: hypothetical protein HYV59_15835 [Planctomycetes bacterium]|nr:hypothetical protein [Planctomycetota bacterium]
MDKYGETVAEALEVDDCFSSTGGTGEQVAEFWVNYVSGTAYIKSTSQNQKRDNALRHYPFSVFA